MKNESQQKNETKKNQGEVTGFATALVVDGPWVQIFPAAAEWYGADGRGPYRMSNPQRVILQSRSDEFIRFSMIDRDHARQLAPAGTPVKAAGWFTEYEVREDGSVWGRVDWTPKGKSELDDREFRYFSPTFRFDKATREITVITGGSLTNTPNFREMQALASKEKTKTQTPSEENNPMKKELIALAKSLGLDPEASSEEEILAAARKSQEKMKKLEEDVASIKKLVKLDDDADIASVQNAVKDIAGKQETASATKVDPEEYVPRKMYDELATRMDNFEKDVSQKNATETVASAIKDGKITPAQKEWAEDYARSNPDGFKKFLDKQPKIVGGNDETATAARFAEENGGLTEADVEVAKQLGVDPDKLKDKKNKEEAA